MREVKEGSKERKGGDRREEGEKGTRIGYTLTLTDNKFDMTLTHLVIEEYVLALDFGLCSLDNKYKMENIQLDKNFLSSALGHDFIGSKNTDAVTESRPMPGKQGSHSVFCVVMKASIKPLRL